MRTSQIRFYLANFEHDPRNLREVDRQKYFFFHFKFRKTGKVAFLGPVLPKHVTKRADINRRFDQSTRQIWISLIFDFDVGKTGS